MQVVIIFSRFKEKFRVKYLTQYKKKLNEFNKKTRNSKLVF